MGILNRTLATAINYFKQELTVVFDAAELTQILHITFTHFFNLDRVDLSLNKSDLFSDSDFEKLTTIVAQLKTKKPLAHIIGEWEFYDLRFKVSEHTLIPRPETEELVRLIIEENKTLNQLSLLDVGTGTGCIAIALKNNLLNSAVLAVDVSEKALQLAKENAALNNVSVDFNLMNILKPKEIANKFNVIVSNPPYITLKEKKLMQENVLNFEPHLALFVADETPLIFYIAIANFALNHLTDKGKLYFEINEFYGEEVKLMLINKKFKNVNIVKDINGRDRIVSCNS
ncbi:MAG: peptide chain release factor N(5)-glutamine methyltransferase [Vicingaceae bacterium]